MVLLNRQMLMSKITKLYKDIPSKTKISYLSSTCVTKSSISGAIFLVLSPQRPKKVSYKSN